jgi:hypothetical protein
VKKFQVIINLILDRKRDDESKLLTDAESTKLQTEFSIKPQQVSLMVDACSYVFEQALYLSISSSKVDSLVKQLIQAGISEEHARCFGNTWKSFGDEYIEKMKDKTLGGPLALKGVNWRLQVKVGQDSLSKLKEPHAVFEFVLGKPEVCCVVNHCVDCCAAKG